MQSETKNTEQCDPPNTYPLSCHLLARFARWQVSRHRAGAGDRGRSEKVKSFQVYSALSFLLISSGCASYTGPGIQKKESDILERSYYWGTFGYPTDFPDPLIENLFVNSLDDELDGEYAEKHLSQLVWALAAVGDKHFSNLLSAQPQEIQRATLRSMSAVWDYHHLKYPLTQNLIKE